ncbi:hypothetical protein ACIRF8_31565 [Streptomyces sp. NPDC102406]|uniref:hypothetical protein n=1 Tax=Streptomyces sp. NPDC102406 TaxID=3366171 RepID=UPI0037F82AAC
MTEVATGGASWEIDGNTGGELAGRWWKWALSAPDDRSPVKDTTGEHAAWDQPDDVWFLAGTYGGRTTRTCPLPAGRPVFFPVLNMQHSRSHSKTPLSLPVAEALARLNGMPLQLSEFAGPFRTRFTRRYAWGLWGVLAPLIPGQYVLEIKADTGEGFWVDTTYHLTATAD